MKEIKKILMLLMVICMLVGMNVNTVFATETTENTTDETKEDETKEDETKVEQCRILIFIGDKTDGLFLDDVDITFFNISTNMEYTYKMTSADYLFNINTGGSLPYGEYKISINYNNKDKFSITNEDKKDISSFTADSKEYTFKWIVESKDGEKGTTKEETKVEANIVTKAENETKSTEKAEEQGGEVTGNSSADEAWSTFLNSVKVIESDAKYSTILKFYENTKTVYATYYVSAYEGGKEEDYLNLSNFQQFLWYSTYIEPVKATTAADYQTYFGSLAKWNSNVVGNTYNLLKNQGAGEQAEAYKTLMEWQYNYFMENGAMYNFMTGVNSIEQKTTEANIQESEAVESNNNQEQTISEIENSTEENGQEQGVWTNFVSLCKANIVSIIILIVLAGATIGVFIYRKRKTIDDVDDK